MLLRKLTLARGVSGNEGGIRALLQQLAVERGATVRIDRIGNLIATKDGGDAKAPHLLGRAHG